MTILSSGIKIGRNASIDRNGILGVGNLSKLGEIVIGDNAIIRSGSVIYYGSKIGNDFKTGHNVVIREHNIIGDNVSIGGLTELNVGNTIGNNVSIHYGCFLERTTIGNYSFIAPGVIFLDDKLPVDPNPKDWRGANVGNDVCIGGGSVIAPWITIGDNVLIGMGSSVIKDVPEGEFWAGNPARFIRKISELRYKDGTSGYIPGNRKRYTEGHKNEN